MSAKTEESVVKDSVMKEDTEKGPAPLEQAPVEIVPLETPQKGRWERSWPTIACGAGLFSDGYLNGVIGQVNTILSTLYPKAYSDSPASQNVSAITFAGTVVGMLIFGYTSDHWSRKWSLIISTIILFLFAALCAGAYGYNDNIYGLFAALTAYRFFLGIGIGGEYPAGSVAASENTGELKDGHRNRWFIMFTNFQIDLAYVVSALVPMILVLIFTEDHLRAVWRVALGLGVIPPLSLFYLRLKMSEPEEFSRERMHKFPIKLIVKFYWKRLTLVSLIWFIYDFMAYSFNIYSSKWLSIILGDNSPMWKTFGWNTVLNLFYIPGSFAGAWASDWIGPKRTLAIGVGLQGVVGFIMAGCYKYLATPENVAAFVVVLGIFQALGEFGPGDNIGLVASKTSATAIRGQYYSYAAASGKIGAFVGTYVIPIVQKNAPNKIRSGMDPFFVSSSLCLLSSALAFFLLPQINQDTITAEDARFRAFLQENGYNTATMGTKTEESTSEAEELK
ncbi:major facilitator superfamily domain-containing protein [Penicillium lagena]|uniref:major facilitator superfamily domain-containing protein n=1 Tax=Penicillium lagena TaxID=94218 RepID=UPI002540E428|nr:major facilitator superfamily domain-containing protein [Penicillium lagena]KAJ5612520.1 major facilitator superfamily domain-containing protein [Penicillium lagena]